MRFKSILILFAILIILWPQILSQDPSLSEPKSLPRWLTPIYQEIIDALKENGFTIVEIDSIFQTADIGYQEFLKEEEKKEQLRQIYQFVYSQCYYWLPDSTIETIVKQLLGEEELPLFCEESVNLGKKFLKENKQALSQLEKQYGVHKEIIVAILRIETCFGNNLGQYHVFHVFDEIICSEEYSQNVKKWIKQEMISLFILCRDNNLDISKMRGSWSGAIGLVQFMPTSYLRFTVDGNEDGLINLFEWEDALPSAANYLQKAGWRKSNLTKVNRKAVWLYNRHWGYVNNVIRYARKIGFKY